MSNGAKFKFIDKFDDLVQDKVDDAAINMHDEVRNQIDYIISDLAYSATADIMEDLNLNEDKHFDQEEVHDEIFQELTDKVYTELGVY